jgi:hypothetical protein
MLVAIGQAKRFSQGATRISKLDGKKRRAIASLAFPEEEEREIEEHMCLL